ncbi:MAG: lamin tail domain-containing protein, partial [Myxococcota bacterium]|nr:lamin tail domain-containing protein [Myxococcota bacterium]
MLCETGGVCAEAEVSAPGPGDVIVNELMLQPTQVSAGVGVWLELHNPGETILDLEGCSVGYAGGSAVSISAPLLIAAGGFRVLAPTTSESGNGGIPADFAYGNALTLSLAPATLQLQCDGALVDELSYSPVDWPITPGASLSLSPYHRDSADNDTVGWWCLAQTPYGAGDLGTPGAPNAPCPGDEEPIDDCRVEGPAEVEALAGAVLSVAGYVVETGVTDLSPQTDTNDFMVVEAGWGPVGDDPDGETWTWTSAQPDPGWNADEGEGSALEDRWEALMDAPPAGSYALLVRASADGGHTWSTCDLDGAVNGLDLAQAVTLVSSPSACDPSPCVEPPAPDCDGSVVVDWETPVFCSVVDDATECAWSAFAVVDCADQGAECESGVCVNFPEVPGPGEVVISELLIVPAEGEGGEWIELTHVGADSVTLTGCALESGAGQTWSFVTETPLEAVVLPGTVILAARSPSAGEEPTADFAYGEALSLGNGTDEVRLVCDEVDVDVVAWDATANWAIPIHTSMSLSGNRLDAVDNDDSTAWCFASTGTDGAVGTPGLLNPLCPSLDGVIESCILEGPVSLVVEHGGQADVALRMEDVGTTDASTGVDPAPGLGAQVGYGPSGTTPGDQWTWFSAAPD